MCSKICIPKKPLSQCWHPNQVLVYGKKTMGGREYQYWEFIPQAEDTYLIRLKGSELYITISSEKEDTLLVLMPKQNSKKQIRKLIRQSQCI